MKKFKSLLMIFAVMALIVGVQPKAEGQAIYKLLSVHGLESDTVTNSATVTLTSGRVAGGATTATVQVNAKEINGTTAGTLTLFGSLDGINWVALTDSTTVPAITTKTATDVASQSFIWRVTGNPVAFYRVSWTGNGTMSDSFWAFLLIR